jgi:Fe2+ or Zn2+ uptake regulation protein
MSAKQPDMNQEEHQSNSYLRDAGLRRTPVRSAVLDLLAKASRPLGVPDMLGKLPHGTDVVTVYRTLNTFTRKKLVHRIQAEDRSWRYALGTSRWITAIRISFAINARMSNACLARRFPRGCRDRWG